MKIVLLTTALFVALSTSLGETTQKLKEWELFKIEHMKEYATEEEELMRRNVFFTNLHKVKQHNLKYESGEVSHRAGVNVYSDMTQEEKETKLFSCLIKSNRSSVEHIYERTRTYKDIPKSLDWRKKGAVTGIKDQGACGSCWAFAVIGSLEGMNFVKNGKLVSLSEQNLVDCDKLDNACMGGSRHTAYTFISKNRGIDTEASYPYTGKKGDCKFNTKTVGAKVKRHVQIPKGAEDQLKQVVATKGPVTVGVSLNEDFFSYAGGLFNSCDKDKLLDKDKMSHAVVVIGYGTTKDGEDYWLIKNSWGHSWGMQGYMTLARGKNMCGVAEDAVYPVV